MFDFDTGGQPSEVPDVAVDIDPALGMTGAYTLFNMEPCPGSYDWLQLVDPEGRTRYLQPRLLRRGSPATVRRQYGSPQPHEPTLVLADAPLRRLSLRSTPAP